MQMLLSKYFNYERLRPLDPERDGCLLEEWSKLHGKALFAKHPKGFLVFLPPDQISPCDKSSVSNSHKECFKSEFHARRINLTVQLLKEALREKRSNLKILDIGCGQGYITQAIQAEFPNAEISGLDNSISAIEYAHDHFPGIDFILGDACDLPYSQEYFDAVVCNNLWEHIPNPLCLLSMIDKVLRPDGFLTMSTPSRYRLGNLMRIIRGKPVTFMSENHVTEYSVGQVIEQLGHGGFRVMKFCSQPIKIQNFKAQLARKMFKMMVRITGSHHQLESTVFYLAQKTSQSAR